jgi:hypothetical protein
VKILQEKAFSLDYIISEPETKEAVNRLGMTIEEVRDAANSVVSISVSALKQ